MNAPTEQARPHPGDDDDEGRLRPGYVYVMSNQETGNSVTVFRRGIDGELTRLKTYVTGGLGIGRSYDLELASDPTVSQASLILSPDERFLFACDAGSNEVSCLRIVEDRLELVSRVPSGGIQPVSLTAHENLLYVANTGGLPPNNPPNPDATISGFTIAQDGKLTPIAESTRSLPGGPSAAPSQISFRPDGTQLVVTERQTNSIVVFPVDEYGRPGDPVVNQSNGPGPFTATFHGADVLLVTEVIGVNFTFGALSTYKVGRDGKLTVISGSVNTTELTSCWTVRSILDPDVEYIANAQSGTISGVRFNAQGQITPFPPDGHLVSTRDSHATQDLAISSDGRFLYCLVAGFDEKLADPRLPNTHVPGTPFSNRMSLAGFRVEASGSLTPLRGYGVADDPPTVIGPGLLKLQEGLAPGSEGLVAI
ncbi:MAG TPA: beta-propeller fold lactonase family protein [Actinophytocola sp.]|uniref:lactonase family protein n=1 Tax=Actinophytocola sp. TaxID=1872138 RepID=UPI002DDD33A7|nr:beta-propeller fold lactonase family protein [Actinophytocola sp.]HEV2780546.1 beta-propeller fold lactonase family protein [Actinophytocola sp.]